MSPLETNIKVTLHGKIGMAKPHDIQLYREGDPENEEDEQELPTSNITPATPASPLSDTESE